MKSINESEILVNKTKVYGECFYLKNILAGLSASSRL